MLVKIDNQELSTESVQEIVIDQNLSDIHSQYNKGVDVDHKNECIRRKEVNLHQLIEALDNELLVR
jgi:hypothetical protein